MYCSNCGEKTLSDNKFCAKCGTKQDTKEIDVINLQSETLDLKNSVCKEYKFSIDKFLFGYSNLCYCTIYTDISIDKSTVNIHQWNKSFFWKHGDKKHNINANDITAVSLEKVYSWGWIVYGIAAGGLSLLWGSTLLGLCALIAFFFFKRKKIYLFHKAGRIYIPDEGSIGMEQVKDMMDELKKINPNISINDKL